LQIPSLYIVLLMATKTYWIELKAL
jgi:hypothetical protein